MWGSGSGSPQDPDWFRNLRRVEETDVQVRSQHYLVRPRELTGAERDSVWRERVLVAAPEVQKYALRAGRTIPVAVLEVVGAKSG